jgi:ATP-dependent Clp protease, protease subunit
LHELTVIARGRCVQKRGPRLAYTSEAFAIYDCMRHIKAPIHTLCVGSAFGEAAMLLAAGVPGMRAALPSSTIMLRQPIQRFEQMQASDVDIYRIEMRCDSVLLDGFVGAWGS